MGSAETPLVVYVVDDSKTMREMVSLQLKQIGCEPVPIESGEKCLEVLQQKLPGLILMDLTMGTMRGDDCCRMIKETPAWCQIPVIMLTGEDAPHEVMHVWRAAADDFLPKPIRKAQLDSKVGAIKQALNSAPPSTPAVSHARILFIDDSVFYRKTLGGALEHAGFHMLYAKDVAEAEAKIAEYGEQVDAFVIDMLLPGGKTGMQLAAQIRAEAKLRGKPLLLMSGTDQSALLSQAMELTGEAVLDKKTVTFELIVQKVNAALRRVSVDLRAALRTPFFSVVEFRKPGTDDWFSGFSYDVTDGGIFLRTLTPVPQNTDLELKVSFMGRRPAPVSAGKVAWSNPYNPRATFSYPIGMGIKFTRLDPAETEQMQKLVRRSATQAA